MKLKESFFLKIILVSPPCLEMKIKNGFFLGKPLPLFSMFPSFPFFFPKLFCLARCLASSSSTSTSIYPRHIMRYALFPLQKPEAKT